MTQDNRFLKRAYVKYLFPIMFSVLGGTINALIDSVFVSHVAGSAALAAVNLSMPVYLVQCTAGSLIAGGAYVLSAQAVGRERTKTAERYYHTALTLSLIFGALVTVAGLALCAPIAAALSQGGSLYGYVYDYCLISLLGSIPMILFYLPMNYLQLEGKMRDVTAVPVILVTVDIALDALFMLPLGMGLRGAALASVISTLLGCVYAFCALERGVSNYHTRLGRLGFFGTAEIVRIGSPMAFNNLFDALRLLGLNAVILSTGGEGYAAIWAVLNTLSELSLIIVSGVPRAGAPMLGVYYSARENNGIRILLRLECVTGLLLSAGYALALIILQTPIRLMFHLEGAVFFPLACLGTAVISYVFCGIWDVFFQSCGKVGLSNLLLAARKLALPLALALLLRGRGELLWSFLPLSGVLTLALGGAVTGVLAARSKKTDRPLSRFLLLDDVLERENKVLDFSIPPDMVAVCDASEQIQGFCGANHMGPRQSMQLGLSIEELLNVLIQKIPEMRSVDLRSYALDDMLGLRIRYVGQSYNPFHDEDSDEDFLMGINLLRKLSDVTTHTYSLGMNTLNILFDVSKEHAET